MYDTLIPRQVKEKFNWMTVLKMKAEDEALRNQAPLVDLPEKHVQRTKVLANRTSLLQALPKNAVVAEIGVDEGTFSSQILNICSPKKLHLIDAWDSAQYGIDKFNATKKAVDFAEKGVVEISKGYSYVELEKFPDGFFDWVYLDTDHMYGTTVKELEVCLRKVKDGGIISGHDYVTRCYNNYTRYGVVEAVNEFCMKYDWEFIYLTHETYRHISYAIRKI